MNRISQLIIGADACDCTCYHLIWSHQTFIDSSYCVGDDVDYDEIEYNKHEEAPVEDC